MRHRSGFVNSSLVHNDVSVFWRATRFQGAEMNEQTAICYLVLTFIISISAHKYTVCRW